MKRVLLWATILGLGALVSTSASAQEVRVPGHRFDPLATGEPTLAAGMRAGLVEPGFRLVQLAAAATPARARALEAAGARVLQYYPFDTFLVWLEEPARASAVAALPFVRWQGAFHPAYKLAPELAARKGKVRNVEIVLYDDGRLAATLAELRALAGREVALFPGDATRRFWHLIVELEGERLAELARWPAVLWLGWSAPEPELEDEVTAQIVAGNYDAQNQPFPGYASFLAQLDLDGAGVVFAITDSGIDYDHPDVGPRIVGGQSYAGCPPSPPGDSAANGHGTHLAGIVAGDAATGRVDENGFLWGQGLAPAASLFAQNPLCPTRTSWPPAGGWPELTKHPVLGGALGSNNSWQTGEGTDHGYQASEQVHDALVRDGNLDTPAAEPFVLVFAAGNFGQEGLTAPKEAKNLIVAANSLSARLGAIDQIYSTSSRGPTADGRWVPHVAAPGTQVASARADTATQNCGATAIPGTDGLYTYCWGTSMAAPHVAGAVVLLTQKWRREHGGATPSPALAKAMVVNTAVDMGTPDVPNGSEGWGRLSLPELLAPTVAILTVDQETIFTEPGQSWRLAARPADPAQPLRVTLAWSDAPGAIGANPALVNDLDLRLERAGQTFWGNRFENGLSAPGGGPDRIDNLENLHLGASPAPFTLTVTAAQIAGDGIPANASAFDQDFALVCWNCLELTPLFEDGFESGDASAWAGP